ncbi:MAG TPA: hypothetical protein VII47_04520 [Actinomycetota bacterium]|jgi:hypothetical protein
MRVLQRDCRRMAAWGAAAAVLYVVAASLSVSLGLVRGRTLYDGLPAQPYRWVTPPPQRVGDNQKPDSIETTTNINASGLPDPQSVSTGDLQATVIFEKVDPNEYAPDRPTDMKVKITPLDPTTVGPRPAGRYFDSNAYRIEAVYPSGTPVVQGTFDVVLTYGVHSTDIRRWNGAEWVALERPSADRTALQIYSPTPALGIFVATGPGDKPQEPGAGASKRVLVYVVLGLGAAVGVGAAIFTGRRTKPSPSRVASPRQKAQKVGKGT